MEQEEVVIQPESENAEPILEAVTPQAETPVEGEEKKKKPFPWKELIRIIIAVVGSGIMRALAVYIFVTPNNFAPGGTNGIAVLIEYGTGFNSGYTLMLISIPLFFLAFFFIGKKEAVVATVSFFISSVILIILGAIEKSTGVEHLLPIYSGSTIKVGEQEIIFHGLLGAVAGGIFLGIALALMLKLCGTSGGTSIIASIINKKFPNLSVSMLTSVFDATVVFISIFVYWGDNFTSIIDPVLLALVSLFVTSKVCDIILQGFKVAYKFEIVTENPDEISQEIMEKLRHGVTRVSAEGMYTHQNKSMLVCIIRKRQIAEIQRIIKKYPNTFAYFSQTSEVYGRFGK